jgi:cholest-4-en-3-one 26-monooxygenase
MPEIDLPDGFDVTDPHLYGQRVPHRHRGD